MFHFEVIGKINAHVPIMQVHFSDYQKRVIEIPVPSPFRPLQLRHPYPTSSLAAAEAEQQPTPFLALA